MTEQTEIWFRRVTIVVAGGDLGAAFAMALGSAEGLASMGYTTRRDGGVQISALAKGEDVGARARWVRRCRQEGLTVAKAPWEKGKEDAANDSD